MCQAFLRCIFAQKQFAIVTDRIAAIKIETLEKRETIRFNVDENKQISMLFRYATVKRNDMQQKACFLNRSAIYFVIYQPFENYRKQIPWESCL